MSVTTYKNNDCKYIIDKLEQVVYLISEDASKNIHIDDGEAYVNDIEQEPISLKVSKISLSDTDELDERYNFTHTLTFSMDGYVNYNDFQGRYYAIVKTVDGEYWLVNPLFPCKVTYTYTLGANENHTDFTLSTISNHPTLRINGLKHATPYECGYKRCGFKSLKINETQYSLKTVNHVLYTNDGFKDIIYDKNTASFVEKFDGNNIQHQLNFDIKFDSYKSSWHYNLLEFIENRYAAIIETSCDKYILCGFGFGLKPSFSVEANDETTPDKIRISLIDMHDNGSFIGYEENVTIERDGRTKWIYSNKYNGYECIGNNLARYLLKEEVDALMNPTGNYMVLAGYESRFPFLTIVGTFTETETFTSYDCNDNCKIQTSFPLEFIFNNKSCREYSLISDSDWSITSSADYITVTPNSGEAGVSYTVKVCNTLTPSDASVVGTLSLNYCNKVKTYNVTVKNSDSCLPGGYAFDISANGQYVTIPTACCVRNAIDLNGTITNITIQNTYIKVYVPQNNDGNPRQFILTVTYCDGREGEIIINQGTGFERWIKESTTCVGKQKCDVERKYTGTTINDINTMTNETRYANCVNSPDCGGVSTRWVDTTETTCSGGKKYIVQVEQMSTDGGDTWSNTGNKRIGAETSDPNGECSGVEENEEWKEVSGYYCDGTVKFHKEELYINNVAQGIYRRGSFWESDSTDCGYNPDITGYTYQKKELEGYECNGYDKYQKLRLYVSNDYINWIPTNIYYRGGIIQYNSPDCGYISKLEYRWTLTDSTQCGGDGIIQPTQQIRLKVVDNDFVCIAGDKYELLKQQYSNDGGTTWSDVLPLTTTYGSIIEANSSNCNGDNKA